MISVAPLWLPATSLAARELKRFLRQPTRVVGALATPLVFWLLIGAGMGRSFQTGGVSGGYMEYFFPGTVLMIVLFTAIFSTISIIEDRREGFLQSVLVAPVSRFAIVLGKVLGAATLATGQGLVFMLLAPTVGIELSVGSVLLSTLIILLLSLALASLGFCIAWRMSSTQGFHAIMNLLLMPLWFLSGALFPQSGAAGPVRVVMGLNPLSYGLDALRRAIYLGQSETTLTGHSLGFSIGVTAALAILLFLAAGVIAGSRVSHDVR